MKHSRFHGTGKVFQFTFSQMMKAKGFRFTLILMILVSALYYPITQIFKSKGGGGVTEVEKTSIETLYVIDESGLSFMDWFYFDKAGLDPIEIPKIVSSDKTYDDLTAELKESEEAVALLHVHRSAEEGAFYYTLVRGTKTGVKQNDLDVLKKAIQENVFKQLLDHMQISEEQMKILNMDIDTDTSYVDVKSIGEPSGEEGDKKGVNEQQYTLILLLLMITTMLISMSGEYISSSIVMEKSSKVVEFLLTSIRPIALLFGKITAVFLITLFQILTMILCMVASVVVYHVAADGFSVSDAFGKVSEVLPFDMDITISPLGITITICFLLAGMLFYSLICGVIAASVKNVEEMQERMKSYTLLLFVGMFGSIAITIMNISGGAPKALETFACFFPVTSPFTVPGYLFSNRVSYGVAFAGLAILLVCVYFLLAFAARCYEYLIYYQGQKLKLRDYFRIFKSEKGGEKNA
ncbi:MAG: ABC transporter permease [Lachnospiraceae bacterium]|nr:ABC transporter permease [Lachnospiraceae bacterium]